MSSNLHYNNFKEFHVDFTCSMSDPNYTADEQELNNMFNSIANDFKNALGNENVEARNDLHAITVKNSRVSIVITMNRGYGFGFYVLDSNMSLNDISDIEQLYSVDSIHFVHGQTDRCHTGSLFSEDYTTNSYGADYHHRKCRLVDYNFDGTVGYGNLQRLSDGELNAPILVPSQTKKLESYGRTYNRFHLPRYCYGCVNYAFMYKDNGTWALYIHQTRPQHEQYDAHTNDKRFGVTSVMFCDADVNFDSELPASCCGWIMPQGPSPILPDIHMGTLYRRNLCWSVFALYLQGTQSASIGGINANTVSEEFKRIHLNIRKDSLDILSPNYPAFNAASTIPVQPITLSIITLSIVRPNYSCRLSDTITLDTDIMCRCFCGCNVLPSLADEDNSPVFNLFRSYKSLKEDPVTNVRRTRSDGTVWEWDGCGMIHRVS